jgi:hypothetical protein
VSIVRNRVVSGESATYTETTPLGNTYGHVAVIRRQCGSSLDPVPTTPSGWTFIGGTDSGGTTRTGQYWYRARGNGVINGVTFTGTNAATSSTTAIFAVDDVKEDTFVGTTDFDGGTTGTSVTLGPLSTPEADSTVLAMVALGGTAGSNATQTGFTWSGLSLQSGGSATSTTSWARSTFATAGTSVSGTATWVTSGVWRAGMVTLKSAAPTTSTNVFEWNGTTLVPLEPLEWNGTSLQPLTFFVNEPETVTRAYADWPFAQDSIWNVPIATTVTVQTSTATETAEWLAEAPAIATVNGSNGWSIAIAVATTSTPLVTVTNPTNGTNYGQFRIPTSLVPPSQLDKTCSVFNASSTGTITDFYKFVWTSSTTATSTSVETYSATGSGIERGVRAANVASSGGIIRAWEIGSSADCFRHSLAMSIPREMLQDASPNLVWPANQVDSFANSTTQPELAYSGSIPMGALFIIPDSVNVELLSLTGNALKLARSAQRYGCYVTDQSSTVALYLEPGISSTVENEIKTAWKNTVVPRMRMVTNNAPTTPGGGTWTGDSSNRITAIAPLLA